MVIIASILYKWRVYKLTTPGIVNELQENLNPDAVLQNDFGQEEVDKMVRENSAFIRIFSLQCIWSGFVAKRPEGKQDMNFLDGIRVFSMSWVILGHGYLYFFMSGASNIMAVVPWFGQGSNPDHEFVINKFPNVFIQYAFYSVDSFYWLSGFLGAFSLYRNVSKIGDKDKIIRKFYQWIPLSYYARYLRLAPMMMFVVLIQWKVSDQLPSGMNIYHCTSYSTNKNQ